MVPPVEVLLALPSAPPLHVVVTVEAEAVGLLYGAAVPDPAALGQPFTVVITV